MTTFRGWNGSGWDDCYWCTDPGTYFINPTWKPYTAPIASTSYRVGNWDWTSGDLGWRYYTGAAYDGVPGTDGQAMILGKTGPNETPWTVSPPLSQDEMGPMKYKNLLAQCVVRVDHYGGGLGSTGIDITMQADFGGPLQEDSAFLEVWGTTGWTMMTGDYPLQIWSWDSPRIYLHSYCGDASASWTLFFDWVRFIDQATGDTCWESTPYVPGVVPNVWNGSGWVPQTVY